MRRSGAGPARRRIQTKDAEMAEVRRLQGKGGGFGGAKGGCKDGGKGWGDKGGGKGYSGKNGEVAAGATERVLERVAEVEIEAKGLEKVAAVGVEEGGSMECGRTSTCHRGSTT